MNVKITNNLVCRDAYPSAKTFMLYSGNVFCRSFFKSSAVFPLARMTLKLLSILVSIKSSPLNSCKKGVATSIRQSSVSIQSPVSTTSLMTLLVTYLPTKNPLLTVNPMGFTSLPKVRSNMPLVIIMSPGFSTGMGLPVMADLRPR